MLELKLLLFVQGLRFLLFDHKLFRFPREILNGNALFKSITSCSFCQGFWLGFIIFLFAGGIANAVMWGFASGIISITWYAIVIPKIDEMEENEHKFNEYNSSEDN